MINVAVDFDGVLNTYKGWEGENELYSPRVGAKEFLSKLSENYRVIIYTSRNIESIEKWLKKYDLDVYVSYVTNNKPPAKCYIDDRAVNFDGNYDKVLDTVENYLTYWEKSKYG